MKDVPIFSQSYHRKCPSPVRYNPKGKMLPLGWGVSFCLNLRTLCAWESCSWGMTGWSERWLNEMRLHWWDGDCCYSLSRSWANSQSSWFTGLSTPRASSMVKRQDPEHKQLKWASSEEWLDSTLERRRGVWPSGASSELFQIKRNLLRWFGSLVRMAPQGVSSASHWN